MSYLFGSRKSSWEDGDDLRSSVHRVTLECLDEAVYSDESLLGRFKSFFDVLLGCRNRCDLLGACFSLNAIRRFL